MLLCSHACMQLVILALLLPSQVSHLEYITVTNLAFHIIVAFGGVGAILLLPCHNTLADLLLVASISMISLNVFYLLIWSVVQVFLSP